MKSPHTLPWPAECCWCCSVLKEPGATDSIIILGRSVKRSEKGFLVPAKTGKKIEILFLWDLFKRPDALVISPWTPYPDAFTWVFRVGVIHYTLAHYQWWIHIKSKMYFLSSGKNHFHLWQKVNGGSFLKQTKFLHSYLPIKPLCLSQRSSLYRVPHSRCSLQLWPPRLNSRQKLCRASTMRRA